MKARWNLRSGTRKWRLERFLSTAGKILFSGWLILGIEGCLTPSYLPPADAIGTNPYGSQIRIVRNTTAIPLKGELIAIDSSQLWILPEGGKHTVVVGVKEVERFTLTYARPRHYTVTIPIYTLATIGHGAFLIFTAPVNLLTTIALTASGESAFSYTSQNITLDQLSMFARFPQGIPANIDPDRLE
jgi:hypothetical protein